MGISFSIAALHAAAILARPAAATGDMIAAHADWSIDPRKRWITWARRGMGNGGRRRRRPAGSLPRCCRGCWRAGLPVALGLDLPLGVPREFAAGRPEAGFAASCAAWRTAPTSSG